MSQNIAHPTEDTLLRVPQVAEILGVSKRSVWGLLSEGKLPRIRVRPRSTRIPLIEVREFVQRRKCSQVGA